MRRFSRVLNIVVCIEKWHKNLVHLSLDFMYLLVCITFSWKATKKGIRNKSFLPVKKPVAALKLVPIRYASSKRHLPDWTALAFAPLAPSPFRPMRSRQGTNSGQVRLVGFQFSDDFWGINRHAVSMTWLWPTLEQIWWDQCRSADTLSKVSYTTWLDGAFVIRT